MQSSQNDCFGCSINSVRFDILNADDSQKQLSFFLLFQTESLIIIIQTVCPWISLSVYKLTPKREVLLIPNLVWRYPGYGVRTPWRDFFQNRSGLLKIQILSEIFFIFFPIKTFLMGCIFPYFNGLYIFLCLYTAHFRFWLHRIERKIVF